ncbi:MAG: DUF4190 domain-containing protein [Bacillota bacterium]|nr:DUF4190 domain-containing protein [Bacillota bacterium]
MSIASLILGIIGMLTSCVVIGIVPSIIGLVLGIISVKKHTSKHGSAIAGIITSSIGVAIFIFLMIMVSAGSDENSHEMNSSVEITAEDKKDNKSTNKKFENKVETKEQSVEPVILYDDKIKIEMTDIDKENGIYLHMENKSDLNLGIMAHSIAINGYMIGGNSYGFNAYDIVAGKKANGIERLDEEILEKYGIESFDTLDILFWAYDNDKSYKSFDTNQIHAEIKEGANNLLNISGDNIYKNKGIQVDYIEKSDNTYTFCLTNTTGNYIDFTVEDLTINDYTSSDIDYDLMDVVVLNNCQILFDIIPDDDFLNTNGIKNITSLEFSLNIKPMSEYENEWKTDMIVKNIE